jgi:caa(3)-type oxidase subunit IV
MDAHSADDIKKSVKTYMMVFGALMVLTIITVGVSYVHLPIAAAVTVALIVATIKGSMVAMFFMHLLHERKVIYWVLYADRGLFHFPDVRAAIDELKQDSRDDPRNDLVTRCP